MTGTITDPTHQASTEVAAPPHEVWGMVADVTRMGEWSPVCHTVEWIGEPAEAVVGARFRGHNRLNGLRWSRECVVTEAEPGRVFAFSTLYKGDESTRWRYLLEPTGGGATLVTEAYEVVSMPAWLRALRAVPGVKAKTERDTRWNIGESLARLKRAADAPVS
jgi:uncharacterized protein YndB with AHSA1/START domain